MKKVLSIVLLISMLMSMLLIVPSSAVKEAEDEPYLELERTSIAQGLSTHWGWAASYPASTTSGKAKRNAFTKTMFDGNKSHSICDSNATLSAHPQVFLTPTYDINRYKAGSNYGPIEYCGIFAWPLSQPGVTDTIRVYFDDIAADGTPCRWLPDNCDIIISPDGSIGSWEVVYSETNIRCEAKYKVYEDEYGNKTAYIEANFPATEISHFGIAFKEQPRCFHMGDNDSIIGHKNEATQRAQIRITEIEVLAPGGKLVPVDGAEWGAEENYSSKKAEIVNGVNIEATDNRPLSQIVDGLNYNVFEEGKKTLHYSDTRVKDNSINTANGERYDLYGNRAAQDATHKYLSLFDIDLKEVQYIDNIKVYLDALDVAGAKGNELLINGFDLMVSEDGRNWTTVYSETGIRTEEKYELRDNPGIDDKGATARQAWINVDFDITAARYVRFGLTEARNTTKYWRIIEIEVYGHDLILPAPPVVEEEVEEPAINSLMLFPLLMRHRQYETETTTTMFGLRVKHLLRSADSITFEKNGVKVDIPAATLKALNLAGSDKLVVTIEGEKVSVTVNGKAVDIEGIASSTPAEEEEEKGTTYRWDFDDLNEKNGANNLTDSAASTKSYTFENGCIVLSDRTTDFELAETITLTPDTDWSIEWKAQLSANSALFGTSASNQNFVYLAYGVSGWSFPFRMVDANNKVLTIKYGTYADLNTSMNTWKAEYSSGMNSLTLKYFNETSQEWETVGAGTPPAFSFELTHMFGRHGESNVCLQGQVDYIEVYVGE